MRGRWIGVFALGIAAACGGDDGDSSGDVGGTAVSTLTAATVADDGASSTMTTEPPADSGDTSPPEDTGAADSSEGGAGSEAPDDTGAATSDTGPSATNPYGMCEQTPDCMGGIEEACIMVASMCSAPCKTDDQCPPAPSGDAVPMCIQTSGVTRCLLDCDDTTTCPAGMMCAAPTFSSCIWP